MEALGRLNLPAKFMNLISNIYDCPQFKVVSGEHQSEYKTQRTGIRQGCPLSPTLFALMLDPFIRQVQWELGSWGSIFAYVDDMATVFHHWQAALLCRHRGYQCLFHRIMSCFSLFSRLSALFLLSILLFILLYL